DKVLIALFLGIDIQHGHPMAIGTQSDVNLYRQPAFGAWNIPDFTVNNPAGHDQEYVIPTFAGIKRIPQDTGMLQLNCKYDEMPGTSAELSRNRYLHNYGGLTGSLDFVSGGGDMTEAHELAYRIIQARQRSVDGTGIVLASTVDDPDPTTADKDTNFPGYNRGPFKSWDDFYFRVVRPWDDIRSYGDPADSGRNTIPYSGNPGVTRSKEKVSVARMIMAHFNSNTDLLKFNPNIEWVDRWGRNFTELEPVLVYDNGTPLWIPGDANHMWAYQSNRTKIADSIYKGAYSVRSYRYKSDEMIDKSDLNRSTTEFCFHSNGVYEIVSTGQLMKDGAIRAERKSRSVVKIYDIWHETTQSQFARGRFDAPGGMGSVGTNRSGSITRDAYNINTRMPLTTQPEALVPLAYQLNKKPKDLDVVDRTTQTGRDCFGVDKQNANMPDSVANLTLPAQYDGQIVLATNTLDSTGDNTTFLASFNGDLDTDTAKGNGREQAKTPGNKQYRVVDTIGLLGALNDTQIDFDPVTGDSNSTRSLSASNLDVFGTINSD
ncbi:MAG: hypothetical protein WCT04_27655, partial [Planctomycetota bacterium]